nr:MAG TPA: hypothetical protein [Microviridae sp.]
MPCYHPITAYRARNPNPSGKYPLIFHLPRSYSADALLPSDNGLQGA